MTLTLIVTVALKLTFIKTVKRVIPFIKHNTVQFNRIFVGTLGFFQVVEFYRSVIRSNE